VDMFRFCVDDAVKKIGVGRGKDPGVWFLGALEGIVTYFRFGNIAHFEKGIDNRGGVGFSHKDNEYLEDKSTGSVVAKGNDFGGSSGLWLGESGVDIRGCGLIMFPGEGISDTGENGGRNTTKMFPSLMGTI